MTNRRQLLQAGLAAVATTALGRWAEADGGSPSSRIDREALVRRHNVRRAVTKGDSPLQVGNGNFAFGADITGLQTFVAFNTMSDWGWHTTPPPANVNPSDVQTVPWPGPRTVPYESGDPHHREATLWLHSNPYRLNLGRIGLVLRRADGTPAAEHDLTGASQQLDLWTGTLASRFTLDGQPVEVTTACHPSRDVIAVRIASPAVASGRVSAYVSFPAPDGRYFAANVGTPDWAGTVPTEVVRSTDARVDLSRTPHGGPYFAAIAWAPSSTLHLPGSTPPAKIVVSKARFGAGADWLDVTHVVADSAQRGVPLLVSTKTFGSDPALKRVKALEVEFTRDGRAMAETVAEGGEWFPSGPSGPNYFPLTASGDTLEFVVAFAAKAIDDLPTTADVFAAATQWWPAFWRSGAAVDLSGSVDPRWKELERRIVLSQYLMAVNEAGELPPQESGLVNLGWSGKFHMEMYYWHAAHYALWNRWDALDRSSSIYARMLDVARARAKREGFAGARWTKMTGPPDWRESPNDINPLLIWQQPHPMFFAELEYRAKPTWATLEKWRAVVFDGADFMASFAWPNPQTGRYDLGPSLCVASELCPRKETKNPTFELTQWRFGLEVAQRWRERLGLPRDAGWEKVLKGLAPAPVQDGVYVTWEGVQDMWTKYNEGHPTTVGALGWFPGEGIDARVMSATLDRILAQWKPGKMWGWDYPLLAMCAARLGQPGRAIDQLMTASDKFQFDDAGLATGGPFPYFPSNGGLLYAVALMAAGWDGASAGQHAPGFPADGSWSVKFENLSVAI